MQQTPQPDDSREEEKGQEGGAVLVANGIGEGIVADEDDGEGRQRERKDFGTEQGQKRKGDEAEGRIQFSERRRGAV